MKLFVFSTLLAFAAAFTTQPITGPAKLVDSPARSRTATIVHSGKANGRFACTYVCLYSQRFFNCYLGHSISL